MTSKSICAALALLLMTAPAVAQKKTARPAARTKTAAKAPKVDKALEQKIAQMESVTQKIVFVDSVIVDKQQFLSHYILNPETGRMGRYDDLFGSKTQPEAYAYVNELGDKCVFARRDSTGSTLWQADLLRGAMQNVRTVKGIDTSVYTDINYPFLMGDGVTMYFAAKGTESVGGYDIFVTRYDSDKGEFLKPENIGMPFNSTANDYMYVIDEYGNLGWFATDRGQAPGKVCVYTFVPAATRENYDPAQLPPAQLKAFAAISSIRDTWGDGKARNAAMARLGQIPARLARKQPRTDAFEFVVNDAVTYRRYSDFRTTENAVRFRSLQEQRARLATLAAAIAKARDYYAGATAEKRRELTPELLRSEKQYYAAEAAADSLEKEIRNAENQALGVK